MTDQPATLEAARLGRFSDHQIAGTPMALLRIETPDGELSTWDDEPAYWYRAVVSGRLIGPPITLITQPGAGTMWRVPIGAHAMVFAVDVVSALLLLREQDARARVIQATAGMLGAGERVHRGGRVFRLVVDQSSLTGVGPRWVDVLESEVALTRARPYAHADGSVWWQFPYEADLADGEHAATVGALLDTLIARGAAPLMVGDVVRRLRAELEQVRRHVREAAGALTTEQRRAAPLEGIAERLGDESERLQIAADDINRLVRRAPRACGSPRGACPEHGATLATMGPYQGRLHTRCTVRDCPRTWPHDRLGAPCDQGATRRAFAPDLDDNGEQSEAVEICSGHAVQLIEWGWSVRTIPGDSGCSAELDAELAEQCRRAARRRSAVAAACALGEALGYEAAEVSDGAPSVGGVFAPIRVRFTGAMTAAATFTHNAQADVYVWSTAWVHGVTGGVAVPSWRALVEALAVKAGAEMPAVVLAARDFHGAVGALSDGLSSAVRPVLEMGFAARVQGDPGAEVEVTFAGYGRGFGAAFRYESTLGSLVCAGGWDEDEAADDAPATWSTWQGFVAMLRTVADQAADAVD